MSLRFRRSIKIAPGLRLNFNKNSWGLSAGVPGARMSWNSKGQVTRTFGIPGTGLYDVQRLSTKQRPLRRTVEELEDPTTDMPLNKPGVFASKAERSMFEVLKEPTIEGCESVAKEYPETEPLMSYLSVSLQNKEMDNEKYAPLIASIWNRRSEILKDRYYQKYIGGIKTTIPVVPGITFTTVFNMRALGFFYEEILQNIGKFEEALEVLEKLEPDELTHLATAELELQLKRFDDVLETTEEVVNEDDHSAILLVFRGIALRELGHFDAAIETFKLARSVKSRHEDILNKSLYERSIAYEKQGKKAAAIKDLEKILVTDMDFPGVHERLNELKA
ncbi:MAG: hypothetical protein RL414_635 [Actinomycetota bacterium]|jgi:tetratricopeptide (TPR) repeat protein